MPRSNTSSHHFKHSFKEGVSCGRLHLICLDIQKNQLTYYVLPQATYLYKGVSMHLPKRLKFLCPAHCKPPANLEDSPPYRQSSVSAAWIRAHHFWTFSASGRQKIPSRKIRVSIPNITSGLPWDNFFSLMAVLPNKQRTSLAMISSDTQTCRHNPLHK